MLDSCDDCLAKLFQRRRSGAQETDVAAAEPKPAANPQKTVHLCALLACINNLQHADQADKEHTEYYSFLRMAAGFGSAAATNSFLRTTSSFFGTTLQTNHYTQSNIARISTFLGFCTRARSRSCTANNISREKQKKIVQEMAYYPLFSCWYLFYCYSMLEKQNQNQA